MLLKETETMDQISNFLAIIRRRQIEIYVSTETDTDTENRRRILFVATNFISIPKKLRIHDPVWRSSWDWSLSADSILRMQHGTRKV